MKKGIIEPVEYQYRTRPDWLPDKWTAWERCTAGAAADYERVPLLHDWHYQVRRLYTMQQLNTSIDSLSEYHEGKGWKLGNLITSNQDDYPALGSLFIQIWDGDSVAARVYGESHDEVLSRANALLAQLEKQI